jgi:AcrR family transcriptional regulator
VRTVKECSVSALLVKSRHDLYTEMSARRRYELKKRAERVDKTRRRITEVTVELHRTIGPAATKISEIARRAGVQRRTVYNHFPDDASLFAASVWAAGARVGRAGPPAPPAARWLEIDDAGARLRLAFRDLYGWYRETEPMTAHVLRDMELLPALRTIVEAGLGRYLERTRAMLAEPFRQGSRADEVEAAVDAVLGFRFWESLSALGDDRAAELSARFVELAATAEEPPRRDCTARAGRDEERA